MAEAATDKGSPDSGYGENVEDAGSRSLKSYTSFDNSSLLSLELNDVGIPYTFHIHFIFLSL